MKIQWIIFSSLLIGSGVGATELHTPLHCQVLQGGGAIPTDDRGTIGRPFADLATCRAALSFLRKGVICVAGSAEGSAHPYSVKDDRGLGEADFNDVDSCVKSLQAFDGQFLCAPDEKNQVAVLDILQHVFVGEDRPNLEACLPDLPPLHTFESRRLTDQSIILTGPSCKALWKQTHALERWSLHLGDQSARLPPTCHCLGSRCEVRVDQYVPPLVRQMDDVEPYYNGPNCWNAALVLEQVDPFIRYAADEEMSFWLQSPLCRELSLDQKMEPGDIVAVRSPGAIEQHGFVHLTEELGISKDGYRFNAPLFLQSNAEIFDIYNVPTSCRRVQGDSKKCANYANIFRCQSYKKYISSLKEPPSQDFQNLQSQVTELEHQISQFVIVGPLEKNPDEILAQLRVALDAVHERLEDFKRTPGDHTPDFLWQSLAVRLISLSEQLDDID